MDQGRAGALLKEERARLERLLAAGSADPGDPADPEDRLDRPPD